MKGDEGMLFSISLIYVGLESKVENLWAGVYIITKYP
jgi:hypothetical protein